MFGASAPERKAQRELFKEMLCRGPPIASFPWLRLRTILRPDVERPEGN